MCGESFSRGHLTRNVSDNSNDLSNQIYKDTNTYAYLSVSVNVSVFVSVYEML